MFQLLLTLARDSDASALELGLVAALFGATLVTAIVNPKVNEIVPAYSGPSPS
jgi:hypothetical protein